VILGQQIQTLLSGQASDPQEYDFHNYGDLQRLNEKLIGEITTLKQKLSQIKVTNHLEWDDQLRGLSFNKIFVTF
jgi:hypothetical protein